MLIVDVACNGILMVCLHDFVFDFGFGGMVALDCCFWFGLRYSLYYLLAFVGLLKIVGFYLDC